MQRSSLEGKLEDFKKEREVIKGEVTQLRGEMEALKTDRKKGKK
jgi:hypothetical protein